MAHNFHIPVLGLGFSIDTPLKVARYGISSVVSIVDDELAERMRKYHSEKNNIAFEPITKNQKDSRALRLTAYLNLLYDLVNMQFETIKKMPFEAGNDLCKYFELMPEESQLKQGYDLMMEFAPGERRRIFENILRGKMKLGNIDVNIMAKVDKMNFVNDEFTGDENTDAMAALRAFAKSNLNSSLVLSAGMNPHLYSYLANFEDFFPDEKGILRKKVILKVSDFRSAFIQAKFLAKKGIWVSEFRIESGLNCGGHAFATDGFLLGPILEEFKTKRNEMLAELSQLYLNALGERASITKMPQQKISVQGGIGTAEENKFLLDYYKVDGTGWGSPFLLVPEVTNVDEKTVDNLKKATEKDYYLSNASPLGVLFNNFKYNTIDQQRIERITKGRPGSPCTKKYLCNNTEFTSQPICTASREYQNLKIKQLAESNLAKADYLVQFDAITEKTCLCEGLCASAYLKNDMLKAKESNAVAICPGPNLAYFSNVYSLEEMAKHIYGKLDLLISAKRPHFFINELNLYIDYLQTELKNHINDINEKQKKHLSKFKIQLLEGVNYYKQLYNQVSYQTLFIKDINYKDLLASEAKLNNTLV
ncbi:MAG: hypothetical protein EOO87_06620 [Pedobacter sp.]|nr:MAG: hypothetical protein EOO87_06620 [Pedobacter sp.]